MGDHESWQPALPREDQPRGAPVRNRRGETRQAREMPLQNVRHPPPHIDILTPPLILTFDPTPCSYHLMQNCWKRYASDRPHFDDAIVPLLTNFLDRIKRPDSVYHSDSDSDPEEEPNLRRTSSGKPPSRTPSFKSGKPLQLIYT